MSIQDFIFIIIDFDQLNLFDIMYTFVHFLNLVMKMVTFFTDIQTIDKIELIKSNKWTFEINA